MKNGIRFAFTVPSDDSMKLTSGGWRMWTLKDDLYITTKELGGKWKVSLHGDVAWRLAMTKEYASAPDTVVPGGDRAVWKFDPPRLHDGVRWALVIAVTRSCLRSEQVAANEIQLEASGLWDSVTVASVYIIEDGVDTAELSKVAVADPLPLANGRTAWLTSRVEHGSAIDPEPEPVSAMIEPQIPEIHGVPVPTLWVRGVHLG